MIGSVINAKSNSTTIKEFVFTLLFSFSKCFGLY